MVSTTSTMMLAAGFVSAVVLELLLLKMAERLGLVALPNERSFHSSPTPSIGGLAFILPLLVYLAVLWPAGVLEIRALLVAAAAIALVGLLDDLKDLPAGFRLVCHVAAVTLVIWTLELTWHWTAQIGLGFAMVWLVNLYNFMDGIDGIAGIQCLVFCIGTMLLSGGIPGWAGQLSWLLIGTMVGFLVYNWPKAAIFMGDTGSGFLGLILGALALKLMLTETLPLIASIILLAGFWFDATWTLCVRIVTRQSFVEAHRSHLYQKVAEKKGHLWTTMAFALFGGGWLLPLAYLSLTYPPLQWVWLIIALVPLAVPAWLLGAGMPQDQLVEPRN